MNLKKAAIVAGACAFACFGIAGFAADAARRKDAAAGGPRTESKRIGRTGHGTSDLIAVGIPGGGIELHSGSRGDSVSMSLPGGVGLSIGSIASGETTAEDDGSAAFSADGRKIARVPVNIEKSIEAAGVAVARVEGSIHTLRIVEGKGAAARALLSGQADAASAERADVELALRDGALVARAVDRKSGRERSKSTDLTLTVELPRGARPAIEADTSVGDIEILCPSSSVDARTAIGSIRIRSEGVADVRAAAEIGDVEAVGSAGKLDLTCGAGSVVARPKAVGETRLGAATGSVYMALPRGAACRWELSASIGSVRAPGTANGGRKISGGTDDAGPTITATVGTGEIELDA